MGDKSLDPWGRQQGGREATRPHRFKTEEEYNDYLRVAHESVAIGQNTLTTLAGNQETLDRVETVVDSNQYMVDKSARTLRGMTFWGSIANWFTAEPAAPRPRRQASWTHEAVREDMRRRHEQAGTAAADSTFRTGSFASLPDDVARGPRRVDGVVPRDPPQRRPSAPASLSAIPPGPARQAAERDELFIRREPQSQAQQQRQLQGVDRPHDTQSLAQVRRVQDQYLDALGRVLDEQRQVGATMGVAIGEQARQMERLADRTDRLQESTRSVIRKASRISQGSWGERAKFVANVAFRDVRSGLFLTVVGDELRLLEPDVVRSCQFAAHTHQSSISGFRSCVTGKWVGQTLLGSLKVKGGGFGRNEEWEVDWKAPDRTFLMCCSANWGNGGYLMVDDKGELRIGGYDVKDRQEAARFQVVDCDMYSSSEYVNEVLRPLKRPESAGV